MAMGQSRQEGKKDRPKKMGGRAGTILSGNRRGSAWAGIGGYSEGSLFKTGQNCPKLGAGGMHQLNHTPLFKYHKKSRDPGAA